MRAVLITAIALYVFINEAQATSVVAVLTPTTIVLGADSKLIRGDRSDTRTVCKIGVSPNVFWGDSGILEVPIRNFSVDQIAGESMATVGNLETRIAHSEVAIMPRLTEILNAAKAGNPPDWFRRNYEKQAALEIVFAGFQHGIPHLYLRNFVAQSDPISGKVSVEIRRSDYPNAAFPESTVVLLGRHEAADSELSRNQTIWRHYGLPGGVRHLIAIEIAAVPDEVGPPIAMIEIDKDGSHWISEGRCAAH
jgi:hypothetical protein